VEPDLKTETDDDLPPEVTDAVARLDQLVKRFEEHPEPAVKDLVFELLSCVDTIHRVGLRRLNELLKVAGLQQRATDDPEVRLLFDLYDLGEGGDEARAQAMLESLAAPLAAMGAQMELVAADAQSIRVRFTPPSGASTAAVAELRAALEQVLLDNLPGVVRADVEMQTLPASLQNNFVPLATLRMPARLQWQTALPLSDLPGGALRGLEIGDERVLLANVGSGEVYAYRNACPETPFPLDAGRVEEGVLHCPWHGCRFDLRGGRRVDTQAPGLGVIPVRVEDGLVRVSIPQRAVAT